MHKSELIHNDQILVHRIRGSLGLPTIFDALQRAHGLEVRAIIWDLTEALLNFPDSHYLIGIRSTFAFTSAVTPRLLVTGSPQHHERVHQLMTQIDPPWPWRQFSSLSDADQWLHAEGILPKRAFG